MFCKILNSKYGQMLIKKETIDDDDGYPLSFTVEAHETQFQLSVSIKTKERQEEAFDKINQDSVEVYEKAFGEVVDAFEDN